MNETPELLEVPVDELSLDPRNARRHHEGSLRASRESLKAFGQLDVVVVRKGVVLAGNGIVMAARELGLKTVLAVSVDRLSDEQARAYALADNKVASLSAWDFGRVARQLAGLDEALRSATSFDERALQALDVEASEPGSRGGGGNAERRTYYVMTGEQAAIVQGACTHAREQDQTLEDDGAALAAICQEYADAVQARQAQEENAP